MITTALFDIDGVIGKKRKEYFSVRYARERGVPEEKIVKFFTGPFQSCIIGEADLKEVLPSYLKEWGWRKSVDEFLAYWFESEKELNIDVLKQIEKLRDNDIEVYLASQQEKYRAAYILRTEGLADRVDGAFFSCVLGFKKDDPRFFEKILKRIGVTAPEVIYWDDEEENITVAKRVGITTHLYSDYATFENQVNELLSEA